MSTSGGASGGGLLTATAHLTGAELLTLNSAPTVLVPAPPVGEIAVDFVVTYDFVPGVTEYGVNFPALFYANPAGIQADAGMNPALLTAPATNGIRYSITGRPVRVFATSAQMNGQAVVVADNADPPLLGPIVTTALNAGGALYAPGDTGTLDGGGVLADYIVDTVDGGGAVLTYNLTSFGDQYPVIPADTTSTGGGQPGVGTGLLLDIVDIPPADGDLYVTAQYVLVPVH
jgi:hypothetical protein